MPRKKSPPAERIRRFTLPELIEAIGAHLASEGIDLPTPSLPTIKNWSRKGSLDTSSDLASQVRLCIARMQAHGRYYGASRRKQPGSVTGETRSLGPQSSSFQSNAPQSPAILGSDPLAAAEILQLLRQIHAGLITNIGNSGQGGSAAAGGPAPAAQDGAVLQAIERLDSVRTHLMRRHDAEVQLLRQHAGAQGAAGQGGSAAGLDFARIEGRLNRIELKQGQILDLLNELTSK
jgi:hypothetical protein